jgi:diguanylate cyclase
MIQSVKSRGWLAYVAAQALLIAVFLFLPASGWRVALEVAVGWTGAAVILAGSVRHRLEARLVWRLLAAGVFLNASGILVDHIIKILRGQGAPVGSLPDLFYLGIFPCLIAGLSILVYRRSVSDRAEGNGLVMDTIVSTVITSAIGVVAWELVIGPQPVADNVDFLTRAIVLSYPLGDLIVIALLLRLFMLADLRNLAFCLMLASLLCFLGADVGWAVVVQSGTSASQPVQSLLKATSLSAFALMGAAVWHPSIARLVQPPAEMRGGMKKALWASLALSVLTAPLVLLIEAVFDRVYGGP